MESNNEKDKGKTTESTEKEYCADCKFEYKTNQMLKRKDGKGFCRRCAPLNAG